MDERDYEPESPQDRIIEWLYELARAKNRPTTAPEVINDYAQDLAPFPLVAVRGAIQAIKGDTSEFFPPLGRIMHEMVRWLHGQRGTGGTPTILPGDAAWRLALTTIRAYQPQTRPRPSSRNPAVDAALARIGGAAMLCRVVAQAEVRPEDFIDAESGRPVARPRPDDKGLDILRRDFLRAYEEESGRPEHLRWAVETGGARPLLVPGIEIPDHEVARLASEAAQHGRALPESIAEVVLSGVWRRAAVIDGTPPPSPYPALPAPAVPLTPERRMELREELRESMDRLGARMAFPGSVVGDAAGGIAEELGDLRQRLRQTDAALRSYPPDLAAEAEAHLAELRARQAGGN